MSKVFVNLPDCAYQININKLKMLTYDKKVAIVTNAKIAGLHLSYLMSNLKAKEVFIITLQDGEVYKNMTSVEFVLNQLLNHRLERSSMLIAFGGGVVGDLTGFVASIYQRGIDFIQIPTTLLSQVDSSVGGKTGINSTFGKNLIGSFHQPKEVFIDTHFLSTLANRELQAGIAEILKMAICFDKDFFDFICTKDLYDLKILSTVIEKSVEIKAKVVIEDEKEHGIRAKLNYGHTFAHVIENETNYKEFLHGEAVAIGIHMANNLALKLGLISSKELDSIKCQLEKYNLPIFYSIANTNDFYQKFFLDKKSSNNKLKFILPLGIGDSIIKNDIPKNDIFEVLDMFSSQI